MSARYGTEFYISLTSLPPAPAPVELQLYRSYARPRSNNRANNAPSHAYREMRAHDPCARSARYCGASASHECSIRALTEAPTTAFTGSVSEYYFILYLSPTRKTPSDLRRARERSPSPSSCHIKVTTPGELHDKRAKNTDTRIVKLILIILVLEVERCEEARGWFRRTSCSYVVLNQVQELLGLNVEETERDIDLETKPEPSHTIRPADRALSAPRNTTS